MRLLHEAAEVEALKYRVQSGSLDREVEADNPRLAAIAAVKTAGEEDTLGGVMKIREIKANGKKSGPWFIVTEGVCRSAGLWVD